MTLRLIIGNKNYSSWSFRPWLAMKGAGIAFEETLIPLDAPDFKARLKAANGAGKVPVLIDGDTHVWESLAILEYLAEKFPAAGLWPREPQARAHARAIASEMHAGFQALRRDLPMNIWRPVKVRPLDAAADRRRAHRCDLERMPRAVRRRRAVSLRHVRRRRRHVRPGGLAFPYLRGRSRCRGARLHERPHGDAGLDRMARGRAARALGVAARRGRLAGRAARVNEFTTAFPVRAAAAVDSRGFSPSRPASAK